MALREFEIQRSRASYLVASILVMGAGLLWRSRFLHLPPFAAKYGGDALWALLVFCCCAIVLRRASTPRLCVAALGFAWAIEFSQIYDSPWIDQLRATRLGALILGSTFNWPDLLAYAVGITMGGCFEFAFFSRRSDRERSASLGE